MEDNFTDTQEYFKDYLIVHNPWVLFIFVLGHCFTLSCLGIFAKMLHERAELAHPVFAVIFQEMIVMILCEMSSLGILIALTFYRRNNSLLMLFYSTPAFTAMQFHQVTWLIVTCLR